MPNPTSDRIQGLDGVRACAFLLVLCGHCGFSWIPNGFGVTVFFFLSGYLITTLLRQEWLRSGSVSVSKFYVRRAFRILPPLYCALLLAVGMAWCGVLHHEVQLKAVVAIQLFFTNYAALTPGISIPLGLSPLWSLAVEEHFYLLFPWVYLLLLKTETKQSRQAAFLAGVCAAVLCWRVVLMAYFHVFWNRVYTGTDTRVDSILFGAILAMAANPVLDRLPWATRKRCAAAAVFAVFILMASIAARGEMFRQTLRYSIQGVALGPVFFYLVRYPDCFATRCLEWRPLTRIGDWSYALYLIHYTVMFSIETWITRNPAATLLLTFTISVGLAELVRRCVEKPMNRLRNKVLQKTGTLAMAAVVPNAS